MHLAGDMREVLQDAGSWSLANNASGGQGSGCRCVMRWGSGGRWARASGGRREVHEEAAGGVRRAVCWVRVGGVRRAVCWVVVVTQEVHRSVAT
jgi:hypothetical protein